MVDLKKLEESGHETDPYICASCGNCTMVCPTFRLLRWESYGPRGRLQITKAILEGEQELDEEYVRKLFLCSLCEHCSQVCTTSIQLDRFWELIREIAWDEKLIPTPVEYACKSILKNGDPFSMGPSSRMLWTEGLDIDIEDRIEAPAKTAYFIGCNVALKPQSRNTARSVIKILENSGTDYTLLGEKEICCGGPLIWGGDKTHASAMAERNIWLFRELGVERIIFSCPSCIHSWPKTYKDASGVPVEKEFELLTLSQFIDSLLKRNALKFKTQSNITVTYHDPCISSRRLKIINEPREVIEKIPGVYNIDMLYSKEDTRCCGAHGLVNIADPFVASQIAELRLRDVSVMPASRVITECPRCLQSLELATQTMNYSVKVQDISELVAESLIQETGGDRE